MTDGDAALTLRQWVGRAVRQLREQHGRRQDDLARSARELGLAWTASKIAALERGDKALPAEELLLLPLALTRAGCGRPSLADLLPDGPGVVRLSESTTIPAAVLAQVTRGEDADITEVQRGTGDGGSIHAGGPDGWLDIEAFEANTSHMRALAHLTGTSPSVGDLQAITRSMGEADERARRALGEVIGVYAVMCHALWGRSLTAARDERLVFEAAHLPPDSAVLAARRGHVTRELLDELRQLHAKITTAKD